MFNISQLTFNVSKLTTNSRLKNPNHKKSAHLGVWFLIIRVVEGDDAAFSVELIGDGL